MTEEVTPRSHTVQRADVEYRCNQQYLIRIPDCEPVQEAEEETEPVDIEHPSSQSSDHLSGMIQVGTNSEFLVGEMWYQLLSLCVLYVCMYACTCKL